MPASCCAGRFYDRFKVIARARCLDMHVGFFLRKMIDFFNGKPMLWRFFGVWGDCRRSGNVVFLNLDFCTGGRLKNAAFHEGVKGGFQNVTFDISWTLEARSDDEMPETLLGGVTIMRPQLDAVPRMVRRGDVYALSDGSAAPKPPAPPAPLAPPAPP